jgi:uncharacterized protein (DUF302 family)
MSASDSLGAIQGLTSIESTFGPKETMDRVEAQIQARGLNVFARIDHAAGAADVGLPLAPTDLMIFGNARGGTPLMQSVQTVGIDLPLKILVWQDAANNTWLSYNEPRWIAQRHGVANVEPIVNKIADLLRAISTNAADIQAKTSGSPEKDLH